MARPFAIPYDFQEALLSAIHDKMKEVPPEESQAFKEWYSARYKGHPSYWRRDRNIDPGSAPPSSIVKTFTYPAAIEMARKANVPLKEVFTRMGIDLGWPNEDMCELAEILFHCSAEEQSVLKAFIKRLSPTFWQPDEDECKLLLPTPTKKLFYAIKYRPGRTPEKKAFVESLNDPELIKVYKDKWLGKVAPFASLYKGSSALGLSPAWVFNFVDGESTLLADSPASEYILAGYAFLSDRNKLVFKSFLTSFTQKGAK